MVVPWSAYWERNYFAEAWPTVRAIVINNYVRGAISGLGAVNVLGALSELATLVTRRPAS